MIREGDLEAANAPRRIAPYVPGSTFMKAYRGTTITNVGQRLWGTGTWARAPVHLRHVHFIASSHSTPGSYVCPRLRLSDVREV